MIAQSWRSESRLAMPTVTYINPQGRRYQEEVDAGFTFVEQFFGVVGFPGSERAYGAVLRRAGFGTFMEQEFNRRFALARPFG